MVIIIVIGATGTITKGLVRGLEELEIRETIKTIQTIALLRSARILWFYGISTIVGYLMSNPVYSYMLDIYDL